MIAKVESAACVGIRAYPIHIETDVANGLPQMSVVGLPDASVKEARDRVRTAIKNSGFPFPPQRITVNLAPADLKKEGASFDLAIAAGILAAQGIIPQDKLDEHVLLGELALDGSLRSFRGAIVTTAGLKTARSFIIPKCNAKEVSLSEDPMIYAAESLSEVIAFLRGEKKLLPLNRRPPEAGDFLEKPGPDFSEVRGQFYAKRAVEIAVAGNHNLLFIGPPGAGKTMLARRIPSILPPLELAEAVEITKIFSVAGLLNDKDLIRTRPFRGPHHSVSLPALIGGGPYPRPGEISLSHGGVLFLDEFPEFRRDVLEALRNPLEDGEVIISRAKMNITYPSRFLLIASMNPCPCGFLTDPRRACRCSLAQIHKYQSKISGPILDRIDLHVEVQPLPFQTLVRDVAAESSACIRRRILACRKIQKDRYRNRNYSVNAGLRPRDIKEFARPDREGQALMEAAMKELRLSARAYYKILRVARTIADLAGSESLRPEHLAEAVQYRSLDRQWQVS